uniref:Capsid protein n=1 Tax=Butterbur mosaic virus TaxID=666859 RepID=A0A5P8DHJ6_9VIRU|nr:coat protein [Butterbur mosaic virus]
MGDSVPDLKGKAAEQVPSLDDQQSKKGKGASSSGGPPPSDTSGGQKRHTSVNDVNFGELQNSAAESQKLMDRFSKLKGVNMKNLSAGGVKNGGFETGRPSPKILDALKGDTSNAFTRPSLDALQMLNIRPESNRMATAEEIAAISAKLEGMGLPPEHTAPLFWAIARYCADTSSSPYSDPKGSFEFPNGAMTRDAVFAIIRDHTTLRQFCRSFAPITWNQMLFNKSPPEGWQRLGYDETTKYAAFDVFDFVTNKAAIQPLEGLLRMPTKEEHIAHETQKRISLDANRRNARFANNSSLVTGGMFGKDVQTKFNGSNNSD